MWIRGKGEGNWESAELGLRAVHTATALSGYGIRVAEAVAQACMGAIGAPATV